MTSLLAIPVLPLDLGDPPIVRNGSHVESKGAVALFRGFTAN